MDNNQMDKSLFFLTLSCVCVWLIVDAAVGKKYLSNFLSVIFPFMSGDSSTASMTTEEVETVQKNAPSSSAIGSWGVSRGQESKSTSGGTTNSDPKQGAIHGVEYGATRK